MASCEKDQEENKRQFNLDDVLKRRDESDNEVTDDATSPDKSEGVSMFCKSCLNPYSGEPKSGTIVLKCERCGQTDVVLEEKAVDLDPEEWSGNLMMNRFLQVLKEQEDLQLNIVDPFFADDDFQNLTLAMQEYTFNIKAMAEKMYDIAREAREELEAELKDEEEMISDSKASDTRESTSDETKDEVAEHEDVMSVTTRHKLKRLGATVIKLMQSIIKKYNLPADIMENVEDRIRHPSGTSATEDETQADGSNTEVELETLRDSNSDEEKYTENVGEPVNPTIHNFSYGGTSQSIPNNKDNPDKDSTIEAISEDYRVPQDIIEDDSVTEKTIKDLETSQSKENVDELGTEVGDAVGFDVAQVPENDTSNADEELEEVIEEWNDENSPGVVLVKEKIKHEIFDVLKEKFALRFNSDSESKQNEKSNIDNAQTMEKDRHINDIEEKIDNQDSTLEKAKGDAIMNIPNKEIGGSDKLSSQLFDEIELEDPTEQEEELQVNFYSISSAFINELQSRKRKALVERKDKALAIVHQKIVALKAEVERVENRVHDELTAAYRKKLRKVENQRKQLDKRHEAIQDVEELLNHYARTGQHDKLAELMEQLDIQYEN